ncbi:MAG: hypothetical protein R6U89_09780 [Dehalococcoidia bacterium]
MNYKRVILMVILVPLMIIASACDDSDETSSESDYRFSFEEGMEGWSPDGTDLDNPPVQWSIQRSSELASDGEKGIKLFLDNVNDAGKIWIERAFELDPDRQYKVEVEYDFATSDWGDFNLWRIIAGVSSQSPETAGDLTFHEDTGNRAEEDIGYIWLRKSHEFEAKTGSSGDLHVFIGVWGNWETPRTYYIDNLNVRFN